MITRFCPNCVQTVLPEMGGSMTHWRWYWTGFTNGLMVGFVLGVPTVALVQWAWT